MVGQFVEPTTREDVLTQLHKLSNERPYEAMVFFPGFFFLAPWEKELFTPFAGSLKLVVGCSAGYDHVDVAAITELGAYYANTPIAISE